MALRKATPEEREAYISQMQAGAERPAGPEANVSALSAALAGFNRPFQKFTEGALRSPVLNPLGNLAPNRIKQSFQNVTGKQQTAFEQAKQQRPYTTGAGELIGETVGSLPAMALGVGATGTAFKNISPVAKNILGSGIGLGAYEGVKQPEQGQSQLANALMGLGFGAAGGAVAEAVPPLFRGAKNIMRGGAANLGARSKVLGDMARRVSPAEMAEGIEGAQAARELGLQLAPSEATGSQMLASFEEATRPTLETQRSWLDFKKGQKEGQKRVVEGFLDDVSPIASETEKTYAERARDLAQSIIKEQEEALQKQAAPYYKEAENVRIDGWDALGIKETKNLDKLLEDKIINKAFNDVEKTPRYFNEVRGAPKDSIKYLDQVKKRLDDEIERYIQQGEKETVRAIQKSKDKLVSTLDAASDDYKVARQIYSEESPNIDKLRKGKMGQLAQTRDVNLKNFTKRLFDPKETDPKVLELVRDQMYAKDPEAWNGLVRNEMERRLSQSKNLAKTDNYGSFFYDSILTNDLPMFKAALKNDPEAVAKLDTMQRAFKNLVNSVTVKTAAGQSRSGVNQARSSGKFYQQMAQKLLGGRYDKAAIEIATSPTWDAELAAALEAKTIEEQNKNVLTLLDKVGQQTAKATAASKARD